MRTHALIIEYTNILKKPISHVKEDNLPILRRKNELIIAFLDIVRHMAKTKEWDLVVDETMPDVFSYPLFTEEFCSLVIAEANK